MSSKNRSFGSRSGQPAGRQNRGVQQRGDSPQPSKGVDWRPAPYHFVPVVPELAIHDAPVFHDVQQTDDDYWSGELYCTLEALTPLLAGNYQFDYKYLDAGLSEQFQKMLAKYKVSQSPTDKKRVLEPLRLRETIGGVDQPVVITGAAIKGAIRNPLQALLSAPMERVQERTFSFRPNLSDARRMRPAMVHSRRIENGRLVELKIEFASGGCDDILYVCPEAEAALKAILASKEFGYTEAAVDLDELPLEAPRANIDGEVKGVHIDAHKRYAKKLRQGGRENLSDYFLLRYRGGLDGEGTFAKSFDGKPAYRWALVKLPKRKSAFVAVPRPVLDLYSDSLRHTADDQAGHLRVHPQRELDRKAVTSNVQLMRDTCPQPGDMMFVEEVGGKIVGIGHHFRYRRLYRDSIHQAGDRNRTAKDRLRAVLCPSDLECGRQVDGVHAGAPRQLTGGRGLFGYVASDSYEKNPNQPLTSGIGKRSTDFEQLAGRIAVNWAVEQPRTDANERFLHEKDGQCLVPLRPLGEPKPSAVETYLSQDQLDQRHDQGTLCTYGDTLDDPATGELNGRKFYLHQPEAADPTRQQYELRPNSPDWSQTDSRGKTSHHIVGEQSMLARFVSARGAQFKFTVRFRDVRAWELGALLLTLTGDKALVEHLIEKLELEQSLPKRLKDWLGRVDVWQRKAKPGAPLLALKLGHGRPLGLGSVRIVVEGIRRLRFGHAMCPMAEDHVGQAAVDDIRRLAVAALAAKLRQQLPPREQLSQWAEQVLLPWLQVHRYAGRTRYDYPRDTARKTNGQPTRTPAEPETIYNWHSNQRKFHAAGRKSARTANPVSPSGLIPLDDLDRQEAKG